ARAAPAPEGRVPAIVASGPADGDRAAPVTREHRRAEGAYGAPSGAVLPGGRTPFDGPEARLELAHASARLLETLDAITQEPDPNRRHQRWTELKSLLRELGHRVDPVVRDRLIDMLTTVDQNWRPLVGDALGALEGDAGTAKKLTALFQSRPENRYTRSAILIALGKMKVPDVVPELVATLGSGYENEDLIVRAIGQIGGPDAQQALFERLGKPIQPETRREIEAVLGNAPVAAVVKAMVDALPDAHPQLRASLLNILGTTRDARHADAVLKLLENEKDEGVRKAAIRALGELGDARCGAALLKIVEEGGAPARDAERALHQLRDPETVAAIADRWDRLSDQGRAALMGAWSRIPLPGEKGTTLARETGLRDRDERVRTGSLRLLGRPGANDNVEPIAAHLRRNPNIREASTAFESLRRINTPEAAEAAIHHLYVLPEAQRDSYRQMFEKVAQRVR
ncbi:MAG: HEAT repeat domain-containing protein, partial [Planctomycetota bacterium]